MAFKTPITISKVITRINKRKFVLPAAGADAQCALCLPDGSLNAQMAILSRCTQSAAGSARDMELAKSSEMGVRIHLLRMSSPRNAPAEERNWSFIRPATPGQEGTLGSETIQL
jgi:hypothetical protein